MTKEAKQSIVKGTMILIVGNIIVKIIGAFFKLPLANIVGADGMGLYNSSFTVYDIFLVLSTAGFTLAISKMVSSCCAKGRDGEALQILKVTRNLFIVIGLSASVIMFFGAKLFASLIGNTRSFYCILLLAPAVTFVSVMCAYRGYYQGTNDMIPTTVSQITEAVVRLIFGLSVSYILKINGQPIEIVAAGAIVGITLGELSSTGSLALIHHFKRKGKKIRHRSYVTRRKILKTLFATSIPIGISGIIISVINILDNSITMHRLQSIGCTEQQANILYGAFNMAFTVFSLPLTIVMAVTTSVFPVLSYAFACKNHARVENITKGSLRIIMLASTATAGLFLSLAAPIVRIIYFNQPKDAEIAVPLLVLMAPAAILISLSVITGTILQGIDKLLTPAKSSIVGGVVCLVFNWFLIGNPKIGIYGVPIGITVCYLINTVSNLYSIRKAGIKLHYAKMFFRPLLPAAVLAITAWATYTLTFPMLGLVKSTLLALLASLISYVVVLFISKTVEPNDLCMLPGGKRLVKFLSKFNLIPHTSEE